MSIVVTMKVTVCFGSVRVLVPCGSGELLVRDLVREATHRYKKATGQGPETWVGVRALRASSGGILDPDDRVRDVADDRETLTAECISQAPVPPPQRAAQADGASGSSAGTASPDMFRGGGGVGGSMRVPNTDSCVEVGAADLEDNSNGLQVRRGSEPSLHQDNLPPQMVQGSEQTKRWSAAVVCRDDVRPPKLPPDPPPDKTPLHTPHHFQRQTNRLSMQFSGPGSGNWIDAAERIQTYGSKSLPRDARRDPLGQDMGLVNHVSNHQAHRVEDMMRWVTGVNDVNSGHTLQERPLDLLPEVGSRERAISSQEVPVSPSSHPSSGSVQTVAVTLVKGEKGLGFTITTRDNPTGGHCPIYIKNILPKGAAVTDGRLRAGDKLVSVNNISCSGLTQQQVVTLLRNTPTNCSVDIVVERPLSPGQRSEPQQSPAKYTEKAIGSPNSLQQMEQPISKPVENGRVSSIVHAFNQHKGNPNRSSGSNNSRGRIGKSSSKDSLLNKDGSADSLLQDALNSSSNSVLGLRNRLILRLEVPVHDSEKAGLGISVKGKVTVGQDPMDLGIFIKSVLNGGAASRDGRLHTNDQLLSVNGVSLVGQPNSEAMETLRRALLQARPNATRSIELTIARRTESIDNLARWKDDTPPNGNDFTNTSSENSNSNNFTSTVIYNHTDKENKPTPNHLPTNQKAQNSTHHPTTNHKDRSVDDVRNSKRHSSIVTINNNTSWVSNQSDDAKGYLERDEPESKRDSFEWSRLDGWNPVIDRLTGLRNESYYMATQPDGPTVNGHGHAGYRPSYGHVHMSRSPPTALPNVIIEEDYGTRGSASACDSSSVECSSAGENNAFSRDAVGRRSMSEKRHAALDARATTTYKRIRHAKQEAPVGPALGMRKSSSLESLQTAVQEIQRHPQRGTEPIYARAQPPLKHWLTDDNHGPEMIRGSPQQSSLSHKKPSLLKSLSTMFRIGKPVKKPETEIYGRTQPGRSSEKALSREALERLRIDEPRATLQSYSQKQHRSSGTHSRHNSGDRADKSDERRPHAPPRAVPTRTGPQSMEGAWGPSGHYVNYDEIQQNLNIRREKLSEVQIGQMRRQVNAQRAKAEEENRRVIGNNSSGNSNATNNVVSGASSGFQSQRSCRDAPAPRPQSNYYEYESAPPRRPGKLSHYH